MRKFFVRALLVLTITPVLMVIFWYLVAFIPHLHKLNEIVASGAKDISTVQTPIYEYAKVAETENGIRSYAMRQAYWELVFKESRRSQFSWHASNLLWYASSFIHFNNKEVFYIWVNCSGMPCNSGLREASKKFYGKDISALSKNELIGLVALVKAPSRYIPGTEIHKKRVEFILNRMNAHNNGN